MLKNSDKLEILAPAGDLEKARIALQYGADAVYCGAPGFSLRTRENVMLVDEIAEVRKLTAEQGKKMYATANIFARNNQLSGVAEYCERLAEIKPDGVIVSDPGVFRLLRRHAPDLEPHLSVQANNVNAESAKFWYEQGVTRIVLGRELSLAEIAEIHRAVPELEIEAFCHGAICMSYSGRCLLSLFLTGRDGNRGTCSQPCRWDYSLIEDSRPDERFPIQEDQHGSYILNSKDMCLIEHLAELAEAGVISFKIEGRNKSIGYLATVVRAYRQAMDAAKAGKPFDPDYLAEIALTGNRGFTKGFFDGTQTDLQNYERSKTENPQNFAGIARETDGKKALVEVKNRLDVGEKLVCLTPTVKFDFQIEGMTDEDGNAITEASAGQSRKVWLELPEEVPVNSIFRKQV